ncbi:MAG TPA: IPTL-CTERM sorting domain-containing protein [Candidatus Polarisedimenticolia bacterium]|nr:IPTL-CTERM sorting domain-containing protein [Candidatus Polarisedimenticolia bacterium]
MTIGVDDPDNAVTADCAVTIIEQAAAGIPVLSGWGMVVLVLLLATAAVAVLQRRGRTGQNP